MKNLRLPSICVLCNQYHREKQAICLTCYDFIRPIGHACCICSIPLINNEASLCNACILEKPYIDKVFTAYLYEEPLRTLLHNFKYHKGLYLTSLLTNLMLKAPINRDDIQCLIPIPMHPKRIKERGFNQSAILAKNLAKELNVPFDMRSLKKIINTQSQAKLKSIERKTNLKNAFIIKKINYQEITLIDDLITTGNTANELAKTLKNSGVEKVYLWCCARSQSQKSH